MLKGLAFNPYITINSSLEEIETELSDLLAYADKVLDWDITEAEERKLTALTKLAKAKGSKRKWQPDPYQGDTPDSVGRPLSKCYN